MPFDAHEIVRALYIGALGREPDPKGLVFFTEKLQADPSILPVIARQFFGSEERASLTSKNIADHSQYGEFKYFLRHFLRSGQRHGVIVDVGARGKRGSNSFDLASAFGWKALLIEANPALWDDIEGEFAGLDFKLIKCAVSIREAVLPFYIGVNDDVSSLDQESAAKWGAIRSEISVQARRLSSILEENNIPYDFDILSLDIEGLDVPVLNDLVCTMSYRPELISIETSLDFAWEYPKDTGVNEIVEREYELVFQTTANMVLARKLGSLV